MTRITQYDKARLHYEIVMLRDYMHDPEQGGLPFEITAGYLFSNEHLHTISIHFILYKPNPDVPHYVPTHCQLDKLYKEMNTYSNTDYFGKIIKRVPGDKYYLNILDAHTIKTLKNVKMWRGQFFSNYKDELDRVINEIKLYLLT